MKLTIESAELLKSLNHIQGVVERRNTIPILSNVKLEAKDGSLWLQATDMDIEITEIITAEISEVGTTTAPAHMLYDIVRRLPDGSQVQISFDEEESKMKLTAGRSRFSLSCLPAEDFPAMSDGDMAISFNLSPENLKLLIDKTKFAVSTEETRYYLNGIYVHAKEEDGKAVLRSAATDGHRLACIETDLPEGAKDMPGIIIPRKTIAEIRKLIEETEEVISISLSENKIRFSFAKTVLTSKLIDGTYPDYERVIPSANDKRLEISASAFAKAVDRIAVISEKSNAVKIKVDTGSITISASSSESGSAVEELEASYDDDSMEIGFNSRYLLDILNQVKGKNVLLLLSDAASPTVINEVDETNAIYVLMPMRV